MSLLNNTGNDFPLLIQMLISCNDAEQLKTCKMAVASKLPVGTTLCEFNTIPQGISYDSSITNTSHNRNDYSLIQMLLSCNDIEQLKACKMVMDLKPDTTTNSDDSPSASVLGESDNSNRKPSPTESQNDTSIHTGRTCITQSEHTDEYMDDPLKPLDFHSEPPSESILDRLSIKYERWPDLYPINAALDMYSFPECYTIDDLPDYAIVIGSKAKSIFDIGASPMYRVLRSTKYTPLEVLYYKLICHFQKEHNKYGNIVPIREDQLLFVQAMKVKNLEPNQPDYYIFYPIQHDRDKAILDDMKTDRTSVKPAFDEYIEFLYIETQIKRRVLLGMSMLQVHPKYKAYGPTVWKVLESIDVAINNGIANMTEYEKHIFMLKNVWDLYFSSHPKPEPTIKRKIHNIMNSDNDDHSLTDTDMGPHNGNRNMPGPPPYSDTSGSGTGYSQRGGSYGGGYTRRATTNHEEMCSESDSSENCDESSAKSYLSPWKYISNDDEEDGSSGDDDDDYQNGGGEIGLVASGKRALLTGAATIEDRNRTHGNTIVSGNELLDKISVRSLYKKLPTKNNTAELPLTVDADDGSNNDGGDVSSIESKTRDPVTVPAPAPIEALSISHDNTIDFYSESLEKTNSSQCDGVVSTIRSANIVVADTDNMVVVDATSNHDKILADICDESSADSTLPPCKYDSNDDGDKEDGGGDDYNSGFYGLSLVEYDNRAPRTPKVERFQRLQVLPSGHSDEKDPSIEQHVITAEVVHGSDTEGKKLFTENSEQIIVTDVIILSSNSSLATSQDYMRNEQLMLKLKDENQYLVDKLDQMSSSMQFSEERRDIIDFMVFEKCNTIEEQEEQRAILASPLHRDFYLLLQRKLKCMIKSCEGLSIGMLGTEDGELRSFTARTMREKGCEVLQETKLGFFVKNAEQWATKNLVVAPFIDTVGSVYQLIVALKDKRDQYIGLARVADFATMACLQQFGNTSLDYTVEKFARFMVRARFASPSCKFEVKNDEFGKFKQLMATLLSNPAIPTKEQASKAADCAFAHVMKPDKGSVLFDVLHGNVFDVRLDEALAASILGISLQNLKKLHSFNHASSSLQAASYASSDLVAQHEARIEKLEEMMQKQTFQVARLEKALFQSKARVNDDTGDALQLVHTITSERLKSEITDLQRENAMLDRRLCDQATTISESVKLDGRLCDQELTIDTLRSRLALLEKRPSGE